MKLRRVAILSSVLLPLSATAPAYGETIVVDNDFADCRHANFNSIQAAVVAAQPGDKILVCPGVYLETVLVNKPDLRIEAQGAPGEVVLQGTSAQLAGFYLLNTTGVLVQGFTVQGFGTPLVVPGPLTTQGANIRIEGGSGNTIRKNVTTLSREGNGIQVLNSSANVVELNTSSDNQGPLSDGIDLSGETSSDNIIRHNETFRNGQTGINVVGPINLNLTRPGNVLLGNRVYQNRRIGIRNVSSTGSLAAGAHGTVIEYNHVFANGPDPTAPTAITGGILVGASTNVAVSNNRTERNNQSGIRLQNGAASNLVEKNEVFQNTEDGIVLVNNADLNNVQLNVVRRNGRDGIRIFDPASSGNTIERNVIRESGEHDAHDDGTANVWITNKCETQDQPGLCKHPDQ